jgi:hypothetical protein
MTSVTRLFAVAFASLAFTLSWALVAARPWASSKQSAQVQLIALREQALRHETKLVNQILRERAARAAALRSQRPAPQPAVRVVTLPPLTITRSS